MTDLDPATRARIEAEEAVREQVREEFRREKREQAKDRWKTVALYAVPPLLFLLVLIWRPVIHAILSLF